MINSSAILKKISDTISRNHSVAAVVVPRRVALALVDEMHPYPSDHGLGRPFDLAIDRARERYVSLVNKGGYIGTVMSVPMVVAEDVVVCSLTEQELIDSAARFGVDMQEVDADRRRAEMV